MKKLLTLSLIAVSITAMAQTKNPFPGTITATSLSDINKPQSIKAYSIVWHWGDSKFPMTWLPKPNMTNIDSVEIYVPKRLTYWLNDSTLIIKKP
jgi:hypothetical protein